MLDKKKKRFSKEWLIELTKWNGKNKAYFSKTLDELCKKMIIMYARIDNKKIRGYITLFETAVVDKETQEIVVTLTTRGAELFTNLKLGKWTLWNWKNIYLTKVHTQWSSFVESDSIRVEIQQR